MVDSKKILWENVRTLMIMKYGTENPWKAAHDAKIGPATMTRIKEQRTSIGMDTLEKLAALFKVEPWALLVPSLGRQEMMLLQDMKTMGTEQKCTIVKIGHSLAQPEAQYGEKQ